MPLDFQVLEFLGGALQGNSGFDSIAITCDDLLMNALRTIALLFPVFLLQLPLLHANDEIFVSVFRDGSFSVQGKRCDLPALREKLQEFSGMNPRPTLTVEALKGADTNLINQVIEAAKVAGFSGTSFVARNHENPAVPEQKRILTLTNKNGQTIEAEVLNVTRTTVSLKRTSDGVNFQVPISSLNRESIAKLNPSNPSGPSGPSGSAPEPSSTPAITPAPDAKAPLADTAPREKKLVSLVDAQSGKTIQTYILAVTETHVIAQSPSGDVFEIPFTRLTADSQKSIRDLGGSLSPAGSFKNGMPYYIWRTSSGVVERSGGLVTMVPVGFICSGAPREFGTSFQIIRKQGKDYVGDALQATSESAPKTQHGSTVILHIDPNRQYSGSGLAQVWLIDAETKKQISNKISISVKLQ